MNSDALLAVEVKANEFLLCFAGKEYIHIYIYIYTYMLHIEYICCFLLEEYPISFLTVRIDFIFCFSVELAFYVNEKGFRSRQTEIAWPTPITHLGTFFDRLANRFLMLTPPRKLI